MERRWAARPTGARLFAGRPTGRDTGALVWVGIIGSRARAPHQASDEIETDRLDEAALAAVGREAAIPLPAATGPAAHP
jgi:hypothetical protein